jgi:hypothetical protein
MMSLQNLGARLTLQGDAANPTFKELAGMDYFTALRLNWLGKY